MPERESAHGSRCLRPVDIHGVDARARRTAVKALQKHIEGRRGPLSDDPHGSVRLVAHPSFHAQATGLLNGKVAEANALNPADNVRFKMFRHVRHGAAGYVFSCRLLHEGCARLRGSASAVIRISPAWRPDGGPAMRRARITFARLSVPGG